MIPEIEANKEAIESRNLTPELIDIMCDVYIRETEKFHDEYNKYTISHIDEIYRDIALYKNPDTQSYGDIINIRHNISFIKDDLIEDNLSKCTDEMNKWASVYYGLYNNDEEIPEEYTLDNIIFHWNLNDFLIKYAATKEMLNEVFILQFKDNIKKRNLTDKHIESLCISVLDFNNDEPLNDFSTFDELYKMIVRYITTKSDIAFISIINYISTINSTICKTGDRINDKVRRNCTVMYEFEAEYAIKNGNNICAELPEELSIDNIIKAYRSGNLRELLDRQGVS